MFSRFNSNKCKTQCKLCVSRVNLMRNKRQVAMKQQRKEVADLIRANKQGNARIRVEAVIRDHQTLQAYELIEMFLELMAVRVQLIEKTKEMPSDMAEAMSSLIYASHRLQEFQELGAIRAMLGSKYGKEYVQEATNDLMCRKWHVNEDLIRCLAVDAPSPEDKLSWLSDIAQEHSVEWDAHAAALEMLPAERQSGFSPSFSSGPPGAGGGSSFGQGPPGGGHYQTLQRPLLQAAPANNAPFLPQPGPSASLPGLTAGGPGQFSAAPPAAAAAPKLNPFMRGPEAGASSNPPRGPVAPTDVSSFPGTSVGTTNQGGYSDASAAAAAARDYYLQAKLASEAAERWAQGTGGQSTEGRAAPFLPPGPSQAPSTRPPMFPGSTGASQAPGPSGPYDQPPPTGRFARSTSDIQRAYDAAPGPPSKGSVAQEGPPSAPPAQPLDHTTSDLPSPPEGAGSSSSQPSSPKTKKPANELDDFMARFEALKRK